jgi:hypothetical protein
MIVKLFADLVIAKPQPIGCGLFGRRGLWLINVNANALTHKMCAVSAEVDHMCNTYQLYRA